MKVWNLVLESFNQYPNLYTNLLISLVLVVVISLLRNLVVKLFPRRSGDPVASY